MEQCFFFLFHASLSLSDTHAFLPNHKPLDKNSCNCATDNQVKGDLHPAKGTPVELTQKTHTAHQCSPHKRHTLHTNGAPAKDTHLDILPQGEPPRSTCTDSKRLTEPERCHTSHELTHEEGHSFYNRAEAARQPFDSEETARTYRMQYCTHGQLAHNGRQQVTSIHYYQLCNSRLFLQNQTK